MKKAVLIIIFVLLFSVSCSADPPRIIDSAESIIYVPSGIEPGKKYPLVIALSPNADAQSMINTWKDIADKNNWIIFASKEFRNGIDMNAMLSRLAMQLKKVRSDLPVDRSKIIATGFSGGGMGSHTFAYSHPELISAIVINTGMIHEYYVKQRHKYPRGKIAVFLASPTDFRYDEMKLDLVFLEGLGWETRWIEFEGGHRIAPASAYQEAAQWIKGQLK